MKKVISLLLSLSIAVSFVLSASAQSTETLPPDPVPDSSSEAVEPSSSPEAEEPSSSSEPIETLPEESGDSHEDIPIEEDGEEVEEDGAQDVEEPEVPDDGAFSLGGVSAVSTPDILTSEGGSVVFTVTGSHLELEQVWIRVDKDGAPYQMVRASEYAGFLESVKNNLLSFLGQNVTQLSTPAVTLEPGSADAYSVYTANVLHTTDTDEPGIDDVDWQPIDAGFVVPKLNADPTAPEEDSSTEESEPTVGETGIEDESSSEPDDDITVDSSESSSEESSSEESSEASSEEASSSDVEVPEEPAAIPAVSGAELIVTPDPMTYAGGAMTVAVAGENLDLTTVWVRVTSPDGKPAIYKAAGSSDEVYSERVALGENLTGAPVEYTVAVLAQEGKPAADAFGWEPVDSVVVPAATSGDQPAGDAGFAITEVQSATVPAQLSYRGGVVTVVAEGVALGEQKIFVKLDDGGKDPIIKKLVASSSGMAVSPEIKIPANDSTTRDVTYHVSVLAQEASFAPKARDGGWKRFENADFVVPMVPEEQTPSISGVEWEETKLGDDPAVIFHVSGENLGKAGNSVWVKAVPKTSGIGSRTRVLRADIDVDETGASTEPLSTKLRGEEAGKARFDVYAMAKTDEKKPDENDKGWKRYSQSAALTENAAPHITKALADPEILTSAGGRVQVAVEGEFLEGLSEGDYFVRMELVSGDGEPYRVDHNVVGGTATFSLPANASQTKNQVYEYSTYLKSKVKTWGSVTVSRGIATTVETFGPDGAPAPLTSAGGSLHCNVEGVPEGEHVWVRVSDGEEQIALSTETFAVRANDSPERDREVRVYLAMGGVKPGAGSKEWELVETFTLPALNAGKPEASVTAAQVEAEVSHEGGQIRVRYEGEGLNANGLALFTRLQSMSPQEYPDVIAASRGDFPETVSASVAVPANETAIARQYALQYTLCYVDADEAPAGAVWQNAAIPEGNRLVTVPGSGAAQVASVVVEADSDPVSNTGGAVDVLVSGAGLDYVWVNVRCPALPERDLMAAAERDENGVMRAQFHIDQYLGNVQLGYEVWVLTGDTADINRAASLAGWSLRGGFSQSPIPGAPKLTNAEIAVPESFPNGTGVAKLSVNALNMKDQEVWALVQTEDQPQEQVIKVARVSGTTDQFEASFPVEENTSMETKVVSAKMMYRSRSATPVTASAIDESNNAIITLAEIAPRATDGFSVRSITIGSSGQTVTPNAVLPSSGGTIDINITIGTSKWADDVFIVVDKDTTNKIKATKGGVDSNHYLTYHVSKTISKNDTATDQKYVFYAGSGETIIQNISASVIVSANQEAVYQTQVLYNGKTIDYNGVPKSLTLYKNNFSVANLGDYKIKAIRLDGSSAGTVGGETEIGDGSTVQAISNPLPISGPVGSKYKLQISDPDLNRTYDLRDRESYEVVELTVSKVTITDDPTIGDTGDDDDDDDNKDDDDTPGGSVSGGDGIKGDDLTNADKNTPKDDNDVVIEVTDDEVVLTRDFLEEADNYYKNIIIRAKDYEWKIPRRSDMRSNLKSKYDLTVLFESQYEDEMQDEAGSDAEIMPFQIKYEGNLPTRMVLSVKTGFNRRTDVWVNRYNEDDDDCTLIAEESVKTDGWVSFYMTHCSHYFVSDTRIRNAHLDRDYDSAYDDDDDRIDKVYLDDDFYDDYEDDDGSSGKRNPSTGTFPA